MRAALYCRVSSDSQRDKQTIETQKRLLADYVEREGWKIFGWYIDDGITGTSIEARPAFTKLLSDAEARKFDVVVVVDIDRLTRSDDIRQRALIDYTLKENGIKVAVASTGELLDLDNSMHELIHTIKTWIAKEDRKKILQRMAEGRMTKLLQGKFLGSRTTYGYCKDESGHLIIDELEAEVVREIFRLYTADGISMNNIAYALDGKGYLRRDGSRWTPAKIHRTIKSTIYKGELYLNREKARKPLPKSEWIKIEVPAIIDSETWDLAQERAKTNKIFAKRRLKNLYLLRGVIYCGECGSKMTSRTYFYGGSKPDARYVCYHRDQRRKTGGCVLPSLLSRKADEAVWNLVEDLVKDSNVLRRVLRVSQSGQKETEALIRREVEDLEKKLNRKQLERDRILRLYRKSVIGDAEVERQLSEVQTAEDMMRATKRIEENKLESLTLSRQKVESLENALAGLRQHIDNYSFEQKQQLVRLLVPGDAEHRIIVNADKSLTVNGIIDFDQAAQTEHYSAFMPPNEIEAVYSTRNYSFSSKLQRRIQQMKDERGDPFESSPESAARYQKGHPD